MTSDLKRRRPRLKPLYLSGFLVLLAVTCGGGFNPASRLVDVGGYRLHIRCSGEGVPAVVLLAGLATDNHDWLAVEERVSGYTQVCSHDRAGLGESDPAPGVPTSQTAADDLYSLLQAADITGPVVMVGHSYGGLVAQSYAAKHPESTAAVLLLDSLQADNLVRAEEILGEQAMALLLRGVESNPEGVDLVASLDRVGAADGLGDLPLTVVTAGRPGLPSFIDAEVRDRLAGSWLDSQRELARLSSAGVQVIAEDSGHCIQCDQPELVAGEIRKLVDLVRDK
ncbi:MAG: alpha/beta hydrolase [Chloroflexi bacterium]|nr:alpha/beta hydrolase [Chloroflexota bacterium]